jgi:hypothetical protein
MRTQSKQQVKDPLRFETIGQITGGLEHEYNNLLGMGFTRFSGHFHLASKPSLKLSRADVTQR